MTTTTRNARVLREMPNDVKIAIRRDRRIHRVTVYRDGWVSNSYGYTAPGTTRVYALVDGKWTATDGTYDRRRSYGEGPRWVSFSEAGGRLASG